MVEKKYKLPKDFWKKWKKALLSGEYNQTRGLLYRGKEVRHAVTSKLLPVGHCCLGVACKVAGYEDADLGGAYIEDDPKNVIPKELINGRGSEDEDIDERFCEQLVRMNDSKEFTFKQIVEWIELNVEMY